MLTLTLMTLISTAIRSPYSSTSSMVMQNLSCRMSTPFSKNFHILMVLVMNANTQ